MTTRSDAPRPGRVRRDLLAAAAAGAALLLAGCGGGEGGGDGPAVTDAAASSSAEAPEPGGTDGAVIADPATTDSSTVDSGNGSAAGGDDPSSSATWAPGEIEMRVVNLLADPVDVYVRTSGIIEAWEAVLGVAPGSVTTLVAPPTDGSMVVTVAGAGDPECVIGCEHFLAEISATAPEGPVRTVVMHELDGVPASFDLWESPTAERLGSSNSMPAADPAQGLAVVSAVDLVGADFGLRLGFADGTGCAEPVNLANVLVGGNQTPAFGYAGSTAEVSLYANDDRECSGDVVGGPFTVSGGPGTRTHLILSGEPGSMEAIVLPMVGDEDAASSAASGAGAGASTDGESSDGAEAGSRDLAIELLAVEVQSGLGIPVDQSACVAALIVDAVGVDVLLVDGELVELDSLPVEYDQPAIDALVASVEQCGVDPAILSGT